MLLQEVLFIFRIAGLQSATQKYNSFDFLYDLSKIHVRLNPTTAIHKLLFHFFYGFPIATYGHIAHFSDSFLIAFGRTSIHTYTYIKWRK